MLYALNFGNVVVPHVHSFIWIFNAPNTLDEKNFIEFIENTLNAKLPEPGNELHLLEFVKNDPIHSHSTPPRKYNKNEFY